MTTLIPHNIAKRNVFFDLLVEVDESIDDTSGRFS
jgi:hypothetical protein